MESATIKRTKTKRFVLHGLSNWNIWSQLN